MGTPLSGPINVNVNCCGYDNGSPVGGIAPYVISLNGLNGILTIAADGGASVRSEGGTIYIGADGTAGLGTVTSVNATSSNSNLTVSGGPVTTTGTFTFNLAGNLSSLSGLVLAADKLPYATAASTLALTDLTSFARTLLDDASAATARTTLGLTIGVNVQAFSSKLDDFVINSTWSGSDLSLVGSLTVSGTGNFNDLVLVGGIDMGGAITNATTATFSGQVQAGSFVGDGSGLTQLDAGDISQGTLATGRGGTGITSYAIGDLLYASGTSTLSKLADVAAGAFLRSGGVATAPAWSSITLPNSLAVGDILYASTTSAVSRLADVATGNALISGGVSTAPSWGKITTSHTTGLAASGANADITSLSDIDFISSDLSLQGEVTISGNLFDGGGSSGNSGNVLTTTGGGIEWSDQITLDTLTLNTSLSTEGTITGAGTTGAQTINKMSGTVRFAAAATSLVVTNSLCTTASRIMAMCSTNDGTAYVKNVVPTTGAFTITLGAAATGETEVSWLLFNIT